MRKRIGIIVQARLGASRLPGKVLRRLRGEPVLGHLLTRLKHCRSGLPVMICTSQARADDAIETFCQQRGVACFRGSESNVAERELLAVRSAGWDAFVRVCGDSPLLDPTLVDTGIEHFRTGQHDLVTNLAPRTFPKGQSVEVIDAGAFSRAFARMHTPDHFEHVTRYFYEHSDDFDIFNFAAARDMSGVRLVLDTPEDLAELDELMARMDRAPWSYSLEELLALRDLCSA